jgi:putative ubiquitin-RnfH superfamily antitoxin RatB of RatAB toxin-antitoxin module
MNELFKDMIEKGCIEFQKVIPGELDYIGRKLIIDPKNLRQNKN